MPTPGTAAIVFHPAAGRGRAPALAARCARHLHRVGWQLAACEPTRCAGHAERELAPRLARQADLLVVVAGDGTLREVCAGLAAGPWRPTVGLVPAGNANVVARELGIPLEAEAAIRHLTTPGARLLDLGFYREAGAPQGRPFLAMVEVGLGADVVHRVDRLRRGPWKGLYRRLSDVLYGLAGLGAFLRRGRPTFAIAADGAPCAARAAAAVFANTATYAKGWSLVPEARPDDGLISFRWRPPQGRGDELRIWQAALRRRPAAGLAWAGAARQLTVSSSIPLRVQMDGDPLPLATAFEITVHGGAVALRAPAGKAP